MKKQQQQFSHEFGKIRSFLMPIYKHELKKVIPMFSIFFLISFVYHVLRCMKITIAVKETGAGADILPFLKLCIILPSAILFTYIYTEFSARFGRFKTFNYIVSIFIAFFVVYLSIIYPNKDSLTLEYIPSILQQTLPQGFYGLINIIKYWHSTLFYVFSEMWSIIVLSVLFWGFSNEVTKVDEAKRFYALIALGANFAGIISGKVTHTLTLSNPVSFIQYGKTAWDQSVFLLLAITIIMSLAIITIFTWLNKKVIINHEYDANSTKIKRKQKASMQESFKYLVKSKYARYLALMVISYQVVYNLADVLWTDQLNNRFSDPSSLNLYLAKLDMLTGFICVIFAIFIFSNVIRKYGWTVTSYISPALWVITSIALFFGLMIENTSLAFDFGYILSHLPFNEVIILLGTMQMSIGKAAKYTIFDQSKEIAFIPLSIENQRKSKAMIDGIASRLGKSGSSVFFIVLLFLCNGSITKTLPYAATLMGIMLIIWIHSCKSLGGLISEKQTNNSNSVSRKDSEISFSQKENQPQTS